MTGVPEFSWGLCSTLSFSFPRKPSLECESLLSLWRPELAPSLSDLANKGFSDQDRGASSPKQSESKLSHSR